MNPSASSDAALSGLLVLLVALWMCAAGWAAVALGDAVREHTGSRRGGVITTRLTFLFAGVGGAVLIQAVWL